jgi:hypothetical protein
MSDRFPVRRATGVSYAGARQGAGREERMMMTTRLTTTALLFGFVLLTACQGGATYLGELDGGGTEATGEIWSPPVGDAGETGWGDSGEPWAPPATPACNSPDGGTALDLWSDTSGVYLLYGWEDWHSDGHGAWTVGPHESSIFHNVGGGWTEFYHGSSATHGSFEDPTWIGGILEGRLLGWATYGPVWGFEPGMAVHPWPELTNVGRGVFVVNGTLAYALWQAGSEVKVVHWNGSVWSPLPVATPTFTDAGSTHLWADEHSLFVAGQYASLVSLEGDSWRIHDPGTLSDLTAIWGFGGNDVWVGTYAGELLHYDGSSWANVAWPSLEDDTACNRRSAITEMWGADGVLYFITGTQLARWNGSSFTVLGHWPGVARGDTSCAGGIRPVALWGNSPTEVFLAVAEPGAIGLELFCGNSALLRWDGTSFHRF